MSEDAWFLIGYVAGSLLTLVIWYVIKRFDI